MGFICIIGFAIGFFLWWRQRHSQQVFFDVNEQHDPEVCLGHLKRFQFKELQIATDNFSIKNILGSGGFGNIYKGCLQDGTLVAVKRLKDASAAGEVQFQTEVEKISLAVHCNLLRLCGFCMTSTERLLVYPYMMNGSVASRLRDHINGKPALDWAIRKRIALGAARGLLYLHEQCDPKIIHRDVKAANILLDEYFEAVVGDFGLAKLLDHRDSHVTTAVRGTVGHIAPEYLSTGQSSEKTDVFGFGILLLELVTGQKALDFGCATNQKGVMMDWVNGADARTPVKGEMEGLSVVKTILSAYLHPSRTDDVQKGVLEILSSLLLRYNEEFDGVVLAYFDIKICDGKPKILSGLHPYLCLKLKAKLLLFSPKPGMLLEGTVNKVEKDYIGVIVLGIFNAAIAFSDIREEFSYQDNVNGIPVWVSTSDNHVIRLGSKIKFAIKSVQEESFLDICGSLKLPNTGPLEEESPFLEIERKRHKKEKEGDRRENIDADVKDGGVVTEQFPVDYFHEKEHNQKSKGKKKYTGAKAKDGGTVDIEFPLDHFNEECKHKSKRKPNDTEAKFQASGTPRNESKSKRNNADAEAKDSDTVGKEFPGDHYDEDHKHKSKRKVKQNDADAEVKDGGTVRNELPADHVHKREHKHKSKRKENDADPEVKDGLAIRKELPAESVHEREHKHKSKRKRSDKEADV